MKPRKKPTKPVVQKKIEVELYRPSIHPAVQPFRHEMVVIRDVLNMLREKESEINRKIKLNEEFLRGMTAKNLNKKAVERDISVLRKRLMQTMREKTKCTTDFQKAFARYNEARVKVGQPPVATREDISQLLRELDERY